VDSAENQRSAEERGKRAVMILEGPPGCLKEVLALPKPDGKALTFRERDAIANSVRRKLFVAAKGDIEEAVRLMLERGFDEVPSRRFIEGLKKRMIQKEKTENESSSS
jgi:hypothetical protein